MMTTPSPDEGESFVEHLTELRKRLIYVLCIVLAGAGCSWGFSEQIFEILRRPISPYLPSSDGGLVYTGVMEKFISHIKVSFLSGVILTTPLWLYQIWCFVAPGLYKKEKKFALSFLFSGTVLFLLGVSFVYFIVYDIAFNFLMNFGGTVDKPLITIGEYLSFFSMTTLLFGVAFEVPLILVILGVMGVIDDQLLQRKRKYAIVLMAIGSALVTPPDPLSMLMLMLPLLILYEVSVVLVKILGRKQKV